MQPPAPETITKAKDRIELLFDFHATDLEEADGVDAGECGVEGGWSVVAADDRIVPVSEDASLASSARLTSALKMQKRELRIDTLSCMWVF